jgi:hypothetical protein
MSALEDSDPKNPIAAEVAAVYAGFTEHVEAVAMRLTTQAIRGKPCSDRGVTPEIPAAHPPE